MQKYRYVAIDIDGTLLNDNDEYDVSRLNRDVRKLQQQGIQLIVASGNSYDALCELFKASPQVTNFVAENGGRIIIGGRDVFGQHHPKTILNNLLGFINTTFPPPDLLSLSGKTKTFIADLYHDIAVPYYPHHEYFNRLADINEPIYNLNVNWFKQQLPQNQIQSLVDNLNEKFAQQVQATYSGAYGIDILPVGVNKAVGLERLVTKYLKGQMTEVVAFGDTSNDIEMLQAVGGGYAMKNATADLLAVADHVTKFDNNHDGLLTAIETIFSL